jgi:hypothetical protein
MDRLPADGDGDRASTDGGGAADKRRLVRILAVYATTRAINGCYFFHCTWWGCGVEIKWRVTPTVSRRARIVLRGKPTAMR